MQLGAGVIGRELPADAGVSRVALGFESRHAPDEGVRIGHRAREAAALEDADLDLSHIEPTAMFGRRVDLQSAGDVARHCRGERLIEAGHRMGVEVILNQADALRLGVGLLDQVAQTAGVVQRGASGSDEHVAPTGMRSHQHKEVGRALPDVFIVASLHLTGSHRLSGTRRLMEHHRLLIQTDQRVRGFGRGGVDLGIQGEHVLHGRHKGRAHGRNAPLFVLPRLELVF